MSVTLIVSHRLMITEWAIRQYNISIQGFGHDVVSIRSTWQGRHGAWPTDMLPRIVSLRLTPAVQRDYNHPTVSICLRVHTPRKIRAYRFLHPISTLSHARVYREGGEILAHKASCAMLPVIITGMLIMLTTRHTCHWVHFAWAQSYRWTLYLLLTQNKKLLNPRRLRMMPPNLISASCNLDLWPPDPWDWSFHDHLCQFGSKLVH